MTRDEIIAKKDNLRRADLSGADLREADLSGADLSGADLYRADLYRADLSGADLRRADLRRADLREADLYRADLSGADLRGADLRGADLDFSCWPLWCGSVGVTIDDRLSRQICYHWLCNSLEIVRGGGASEETITWLKNFANGFHKVNSSEVPKL